MSVKVIPSWANCNVNEEILLVSLAENCRLKGVAPLIVVGRLVRDNVGIVESMVRLPDETDEDVRPTLSVAVTRTLTVLESMLGTVQRYAPELLSPEEMEIQEPPLLVEYSNEIGELLNPPASLAVQEIVWVVPPLYRPLFNEVSVTEGTTVSWVNSTSE